MIATNACGRTVGQCPGHATEDDLCPATEAVSIAPVELSATVAIAAPVDALFTLSSYDYDTLVEIGPRTTYRRTPAGQVMVDDVLMDVWGSPSGRVAKVTTRTLPSGRTRAYIRLAGHDSATAYDADTLLNVYVESVAL